ncbi:MAG: hypothetical protein LBQ36_06710 [Synergistaceae bacterium]|jgi:hypothetical protein|nr:hypothetical protein [Synergistaceae bacterium]
MGYDGFSKNCNVLKCAIDGHDSGGKPIYGMFLGIAGANGIIYHGELFSRDPIDAESSLSKLYSLLSSPRPGQRLEDLSKYEESLAAFMISSGFLENEKSLADPKSIEHKITYFCSSALSISAISFLDLQEMSMKELYLIIPALKGSDDPQGEAGEGEAEAEWYEEEPSGGGARNASDVVVACDPVLDPLAGEAISDLSPGDVICCRMNENSVFRSLMNKVSQDFDGVVSGEVCAVQSNDVGTAVVALKLSDGVRGVLKAAGAVRVRVVSKKLSEAVQNARDSDRALALAIAGLVGFLCTMAVLVHFLS